MRSQIQTMQQADHALKMEEVQPSEMIADFQQLLGVTTQKTELFLAAQLHAINATLIAAEHKSIILP
jgi:hypothetical protein